MKQQIFFAVLVMVTGLAQAQEADVRTLKLTDYYGERALEERKETPYAPLREADVVFEKRITRVIDTREKKNMVMNWPGNVIRPGYDRSG
jgi:hypothetical protein